MELNMSGQYQYNSKYIRIKAQYKRLNVAIGDQMTQEKLVQVSIVSLVGAILVTRSVTK